MEINTRGIIMKALSRVWCVIGALILAGCGNFYFVKQPDLYKNMSDFVEVDNITVPDEGYKTPLEKEGWKLVWNDEFDGNRLDSTYWNIEVDGSGMGNNELQYYTDSKNNIWVNNGLLHLKAIRQLYRGKAYTSGRVNTKKKVDYTYGRFDIRAKMPIQQGIWPAIWMLPTDNVYGTWPQSGEIDIMESIGHEPTTVYGTIHFGDAWPNNKHKGENMKLTKGDLFSEFHVYSVEWSENEIKWFVDDSLYSVKTPADISPAKWPFDQRFFILLNLAVGGNWPGSPDETTVFPKYMFVDYVRIYQRTSSN